MQTHLSLYEMNTRSRGKDSVNDIIKPYKTKGEKPPEIMATPSNGNKPEPTPDLTKDLKDLTSDEKLDLLVLTVTKMATIPKDLEDINNKITELTSTVNHIPGLKKQVQDHEQKIQANEKTSKENKEKISGIEDSLTHTQGNLEDLDKKIKEIESKLTQTSRSIGQIEIKLGINEKLLSELEKKFQDNHDNSEENQRSILIQGIPESRSEDLKETVHRILYDTKVNVPRNETDQIFREGYFNKRRARPVVVTFTRKSTRDEVYRARLNIKQNPKCQDIWINERISDQQRLQRNELKALHELASLKGYTSRFHTDTIIVNGITYDHASISRLPADLTLELAFTREIDNHILFHSEHIFLSNFFRCKIVVNHEVFTSLEQAYFYILAKETGNYTKAYMILKSEDPRKIKRIGASIIATPEWLNNSDQIMYDLLKLKFGQNPDLAKRLLATENKVLVEATLNRYWGAGITLSMSDMQKRKGQILRYQGSNWLGQQLQDIRRELREKVEQPDPQQTEVKAVHTAD